MLCFRDMTFCEAPCATLTCRRKFTEADRIAAAKWWHDMPGEPPIAFSDFRATCTDHRPIAAVTRARPDAKDGQEGGA